MSEKVPEVIVLLSFQKDFEVKYPEQTLEYCSCWDTRPKPSPSLKNIGPLVILGLVC